MKRSELFFGAILVPIDFLALMTASVLAYFLRVSETAQQFRPAVFALDLPLSEYVQIVSLVAIFIIGVFSIQGLYALQVTRKAMDEFTRIFSGISIGVMALIVYIFLRAELFQSRFILLTAYVLAIVFVSVGRYIVRRVQQNLLERGFGIHRVVLIGDGKNAPTLQSLFERRPHLGYRVVGKVVDVTWGALEEIYRQKGIDEVIQTNPSLDDKFNMVLLDFCEQYKIDYKYIPNLFETYAANVNYRQIGTIPLLELSRTPLDGWGRIAKRVVDLVGSILGLIILSPLFVAVAIAIKQNSKGPVFYRQTRVGRNTIPFEIYKFRSMYLKDCVGPRYGGKEAEEKYNTLRQHSNERTSGPLFKMKKDPRITKVGRFLRRTRIDELPQLINVLFGDMSLIGPRPHLPEEVQQYSKHHRRLFTIKPGMTGMAQVAGNAGLSFQEEAKLDIAYIENWSLWLDVVLLLKTMRILFTDENAV